VSDLKELGVGSGTLSVLTNQTGGIIDDLIINKYEDHLYVVLNAGCAEKDLNHIQSHLSSFRQAGKAVQLEILSEQYSLLALQGPKAAEVLAPHVKGIDLNQIGFMRGKFAKLDALDLECRLTRCGYTGEDGFEISVPTKGAVAVTQLLLKDERVKLAGLGARDSLRLEAGLCLYGNDLDESTSPVEASLVWLIGKRRRVDGGFPGSDIIVKQLKEGVQRKRVGFTIQGSIARDHSLIHQDGSVVGEVTSGTFSPCLKQGIGMGYVPSGLSKQGTILSAIVRSKPYPLTIVKMPFVKSGYFK